VSHTEPYPRVSEDLHSLLCSAGRSRLFAGCDEQERVERLAGLLGEERCRQLGVFALPAGFRLSVVMPCYNEAATVDESLRRVCCCGIPLEVLAVDDGSTDGTREILARWQERPMDDDVILRVLSHPTNQGKGAALKTGFLAATGDVVLVQDADLEYDPADYWRLIRPIVDGEADVVFGSRFGGSRREEPYLGHALANRLLTWISNRFTGLRLSDMETCYKVFRRDVIARIAPELRERRFGVEPELTARLARLPGVRVQERPIGYAGRQYSEGKKIGWRDGFRALYCIVRY